jgi:hypothetical protein
MGLVNSQFTPADRLVFGFSWSDWFAANSKAMPAFVADGIASATITVDGDDRLGLVSGGTSGQDYVLACTITSNAGLVPTAEQVLQCRTAVTLAAFPGSSQSSRTIFCFGPSHRKVVLMACQCRNGKSSEKNEAIVNSTHDGNPAVQAR